MNDMNNTGQSEEDVLCVHLGTDIFVSIYSWLDRRICIIFVPLVARANRTSQVGIISYLGDYLEIRAVPQNPTDSVLVMKF